MALAAADLTRYNASTYERLWRYAHFQPPSSTPWWPLLQELAAGAQERLEIGPGPWPKLPVEGTHVVDLAAPALRVLAERGAIVHPGLLSEIGFAAGRFDLVALFEVLEHVPQDVELLAEIARITRPGGRLVVSVPVKMKHWNAFDRFAGHVRRYEPDELREKLGRAGFSLERFEMRSEVGGRLLAVVFAAFCRYFPRLSMWITERVMLPAMRKTRLEWRDDSQWEASMREATQCTVVCQRA
jgi:SAM-dependent methyltransferase